MYKILINSADRINKSVSLIKIENSVETTIDILEGDIDLVESINEITQKNNLTLDAILDFSFNSGPGSFTGLKVGATIANVLNWAINNMKLSKIKYPQYGSEPNISKNDFGS